MKIGIDIDDTIANSYEILFYYAQKYTIEELKRTVNLRKGNLTTHLYIDGFHEWSKEEANEFWRKYYQEMMLKIKPREFSKEVIDRLKKDGNEIYIVTARFHSDQFDIEELTKQWLYQYGIYYDQIFFSINDKVKLAKEENIDVFVDDSYKQCKGIGEAGIHSYMMDFIINCNFEEDGFKRVYSWPHLYQEIKNLGGK